MGWGSFVLGLLAGLALGALVVVALVRATGRITGATPRGVAALVLDGLRPGERANGVQAQRALARRLKRTGERSASGRRVAAAEVHLHVGPEAHDAIAGSLGIEAAEADLAEFYRAHARRSGWHLGAEPAVALVRDISLGPRQSFARAVLRPGPQAPAGEPVGRPAPTADARPPVADLPRTPPAAPSRGDDAMTDVLPAHLLDEAGPGSTRAYPVGLAEHAAPGDLLVVHGTDVRTVPAGRGSATVGRASHNDIVIDAPGVGRDHLVIERRGSRWWVVPSAAQAATVLDGRSLTVAAPVDGQGLLELGRGARLRLTVEAA